MHSMARCTLQGYEHDLIERNKKNKTRVLKKLKKLKELTRLCTVWCNV